MLLIPTFIADSRIPNAGLGVCCRDAVSAGTVIWRFVPGLDLIVKSLPENPVMRAFIHKYGYRPLSDPAIWIICTDNARFYNHAAQPNCHANALEETVAAYDLEPGTELTEDYQDFCVEPFQNWHI